MTRAKQGERVRLTRDLTSDGRVYLETGALGTVAEAKVRSERREYNRQYGRGPLFETVVVFDDGRRVGFPWEGSDLEVVS